MDSPEALARELKAAERRPDFWAVERPQEVEGRIRLRYWVRTPPPLPARVVRRRWVVDWRPVRLTVLSLAALSAVVAVAWAVGRSVSAAAGWAGAHTGQVALFGVLAAGLGLMWAGRRLRAGRTRTVTCAGLHCPGCPNHPKGQ